jgi:outer membrane murein-binding lipoprotein Lpp
MSWLKNHAASARAVAVVALGGLALSACATNQYVDERIAAVNSRIDQTDARVQAAAQRAEAANSAAQAAANDARAANTAAQAAATDARTANQRVDQLGGRVDTMERGPVRTPRG